MELETDPLDDISESYETSHSEAGAQTSAAGSRGPLLFGTAGRSSDGIISSPTASFSEQESKAGHELRASIAGLEFEIRREGWLFKNHHGGPFAKNQKRRWFLSDGFHVEYFEDEGRSRRTGRFDLRNVVGLGASAEVTRGLDFQLSELKSGQPSPQPQFYPYPCP